MFPIMDVHNKVIGFGGRVMGDGEPKYLNSPETMIFDKSRNLYGLNFARTTKKAIRFFCVRDIWMSSHCIRQGLTMRWHHLERHLQPGHANLLKTIYQRGLSDL